MARRRKRRSTGFWGFGALGSVEGTRAYTALRASMMKAGRLFDFVKEQALTGDPGKAIAAEADFKKAVVDAEAAAKRMVAAGIPIPPDARSAMERARQAISEVDGYVATASQRRQDMSQEDPEWGGAYHPAWDASEPSYDYPSDANLAVRRTGSSTFVPGRGWVSFGGLGGSRRRRSRSGGGARCRTAKGHFKRC